MRGEAAALVVSTHALVGLISLAALCAVLASVAGTGGGSLMIPVFSLAFPDDVHRAVPLSKMAVFGVALGASCVNFADAYASILAPSASAAILKREGKTLESRINFRLASLIQPATLLGCIFGVICNILLSSLAITFFLVIVLGYTSYKTYYAAERMRFAAEAAAPQSTREPFPDKADQDMRVTAYSPTTNSADAKSANAKSANGYGIVYVEKDIGTYDSKSLDVKEACYTLADEESLPLKNADADADSVGFDDYRASASANIKPDAFRQSFELYDKHGRHGSDEHLLHSYGAFSKSKAFIDSQVDSSCDAPVDDFCGRQKAKVLSHGTMYETAKEIGFLLFCWLVNLLFLIYCGGPTALLCGNLKDKVLITASVVTFCGLIAFKAWRVKRKALEGAYPLPWATQYRNIYWYMSLSFFAGFCAALLGIGGGLIKGPLLIAIGLTPVSAVSTSNYMILFTSSTNIILYWLAGRLDLKSGALFTPATFAGGVLGVWILRSFFSKPQKQCYLTYLLAAVVCLGAVLMTATNVVHHVQLVPYSAGGFPLVWQSTRGQAEQTVEGACRDYIALSKANAHFFPI